MSLDCQAVLLGNPEMKTGADERKHAREKEKMKTCEISQILTAVNSLIDSNNWIVRSMFFPVIFEYMTFRNCVTSPMMLNDFRLSGCSLR